MTTLRQLRRGLAAAAFAAVLVASAKIAWAQSMPPSPDAGTPWRVPPASAPLPTAALPGTTIPATSPPAPLPPTFPDSLTTRLPEPSGSPLATPVVPAAELNVDELVAEVERRNPSLREAVSAWRAAAERYPQVTSLEDPIFSFMVSTGDVGQTRGAQGYQLQLNQALPWCGKLALRGDIVDADTQAAHQMVGDVRLRLREAARMAFFDYYLAQRQAEVNAETVQLIADFIEVARQRYEVGQTTQQDVLQAMVEQAEREARQTEYVRDLAIAKARINTLLHQGADCPLLPPPRSLPALVPPPAVEALQDLARRQRPDLAALAAQVQSEEAAVALACRDFYPDTELMARYDGNMDDPAIRPMLGMAINVPIQRERRRAALREAQSRVQEARAAYQTRLDEVRFEVQSAYTRLAQRQTVIGLYDERILPAARLNLDSAMANYADGRIDFLRLLDAERQWNDQRQNYYQAAADYRQRLAELERAVGEDLETLMVR